MQLKNTRRQGMGQALEWKDRYTSRGWSEPKVTWTDIQVSTAVLAPQGQELDQAQEEEELHIPARTPEEAES